MIRDKLLSMIAAAPPVPGLAWDMTPAAFSKVRMTFDDAVVMYPNTRPMVMGIPVNIIAPSKYMLSEVSLGNSPAVKL